MARVSVEARTVRVVRNTDGYLVTTQIYTPTEISKSDFLTQELEVDIDRLRSVAENANG